MNHQGKKPRTSYPTSGIGLSKLFDRTKPAMSLSKTLRSHAPQNQPVKVQEVSKLKTNMPKQPASLANLQQRASLKKKDSPIEAYDVSKNISLEVRARDSIFHLPTASTVVPITVSLKAKDLTIDQLEERPPIDLICVLDASGSMSGRKLQLVKKTVLGLQKFLTSKDRICLIKFNDRAKATQLLNCNADNWQLLSKKLEQLQAAGGTRMLCGVELAIKTLKERETVNPIAGVFLLTDGQDERCDPIAIKQLGQSLSNGVKFSISTFGFGQDHDAETLRRLAGLRDGQFYYVEHVDTVDEYFAASLGGMMSVVAKDIQISVCNISGGILANMSISRTFGSMWRRDSEKQYSLSVPYLLAGSQRSFVAELTLPALDFKLAERTSIIVLRAALHGKDTLGRSFDLSSRLSLTLTSEQKPPAIQRTDWDVMRNYYRVRAAETIEDALYQLNNGNDRTARENLERLLAEIKESSCEGGLQGLIKRLESCIERCQRGQAKKMAEHAQHCQRQQPCIERGMHLTNVAICRLVDQVRTDKL